MNLFEFVFMLSLVCTTTCFITWIRYMVASIAKSSKITTTANALNEMKTQE
jgi:hypothetical protein